MSHGDVLSPHDSMRYGQRHRQTHTVPYMMYSILVDY